MCRRIDPHETPKIKVYDTVFGVRCTETRAKANPITFWPLAHGLCKDGAKNMCDLLASGDGVNAAELLEAMNNCLWTNLDGSTTRLVCPLVADGAFINAFVRVGHGTGTCHICGQTPDTYSQVCLCAPI